VLFRRGRPVLLADFDFMGERARIDDLVLTLHRARCDLRAEHRPAQDRDRLRRLVASYDAGPGPAVVGERACRAAGRDGAATSLVDWWMGGAIGRSGGRAPPRRRPAARAGGGLRPELAAARQVMAELGRWQDAFA
jgi:hypothetical protein